MFNGGGNDCTVAKVHNDGKLNSVEEPETIIDQRIKRLRSKEITLVKVQWRSISLRRRNSGDGILLRGRCCNNPRILLHLILDWSLINWLGWGLFATKPMVYKGWIRGFNKFPHCILICVCVLVRALEEMRKRRRRLRSIEGISICRYFFIYSYYLGLVEFFKGSKP